MLRPFALWWRYWPQLAALYLVGLLGRRAAIELAAWAGWDNELWASLIMPFAGLARLGSFVAIGCEWGICSAVPHGFSAPTRWRSGTVYDQPSS